jgi:hypothetical protein
MSITISRALFAAAAVAGLTIPSAVAAYADDWCGYAAGDQAIIQCGYSSVAHCETAVGKDGKGGTCFVDPDTAFSPKAVPIVAPRQTRAKG